MIFAAGLGTRLKPLTDTMPKALVRVGGQPLLWHVVQKLKAAGYERIVVNVHHFAQQIVDYLEANDNFGLDIRISDERDGLLETGGGIKKALPLFDPSSPILIHNVDILSNLDLTALPEDTPLLVVSQRQTKRYLLFDDTLRLQGWTNIETGEVKGPANNGQCSMLTSSKSLTLGIARIHSALLSLNRDFQCSMFNVQSNKFAFSGIHLFHPSLAPLLSDWPERFPIMDFYLSACADHLIRGYEAPGLRLLDVGKLDTLEQAEAFIDGI
jgi:NDP-sugar pyrophosphorylase family protein